MFQALLKLTLLIFILVLLPLVGLWLQGRSVTPYLQFPPQTSLPAQPEFSLAMFIGLSLSIAAVCAPFAWRILSYRASPPPPRLHKPFPWWGWLGLGIIAIFWPLAWGRFSWFRTWQPHTYLPLWLGYILVVNGLTFRRRGRSLLTDHPLFFFALFPGSAVFWWFFEYLNRFVQNWHYWGIDNYSPVEYALQASMSFSTVLPAVLSTTALLTTIPRLTRPLARFWPVALPWPRFWSWLILAGAAGGLTMIGVWPNYLYSLLWMAPLLVIAAFQTILGETPVFAPVQKGDWRPVWLPALAALICGFFWELWNWKSLAHWEYSVPWVDHFHIFEMPLLGYAGYLPFGLECVVVADLIRQFFKRRNIRFFYYS